jgi:hypothetical protein
VNWIQLGQVREPVTNFFEIGDEFSRSIEAAQFFCQEMIEEIFKEACNVYSFR